MEQEETETTDQYWCAGMPVEVQKPVETGSNRTGMGDVIVTPVNQPSEGLAYQPACGGKGC